MKSLSGIIIISIFAILTFFCIGGAFVATTTTSMLTSAGIGLYFFYRTCELYKELK